MVKDKQKQLTTGRDFRRQSVLFFFAEKISASTDVL
jgi:hypothetical protein